MAYFARKLVEMEERSPAMLKLCKRLYEAGRVGPDGKVRPVPRPPKIKYDESDLHNFRVLKENSGNQPEAFAAGYKDRHWSLGDMKQEEWEAVRAYTMGGQGTDYRRLNKSLYNRAVKGTAKKGDDELYDSWRKIIDSGLDRMPDYVGEVRRGVVAYGNALQRAVDFYKPGKTVTEPAYLSTSRTKRGAFDGTLNFVIKSKTGSNVEKLSNFEHEAEVLFKAGTRFKVLAKEEYFHSRLGRTVTIIMEEI